MTKTEIVKVPFLLSWCEKSDARAIAPLAQKSAGVRPGRGDAGWTVYTFSTLADARAWAARHRESAMPCWKRSECWGGSELGT